MLIIKKSFDFYIKSSLHLGICVICLYLVNVLKHDIEVDYLIITFLFSSTIIVYNFIKYGYNLPNYSTLKNSVLKTITFLSFVCGFALIYTLFFLKFYTLLFGTFLFFICILYVFPVGNSKLNFRNLSRVKLFLVAFCWSASTVFLPLIENGFNNYYFTLIFSFQIFCLIIIYTIPFEIRDLQNDSIELQTIPQIFGIKKSKNICYFLIMVFSLLSFINSGLGTNFLSDIVLSFILFFIVYITKKNQSEYFSSFWVESVPVYWLMFCVLLK
jgi:hypothetical protein